MKQRSIFFILILFFTHLCFGRNISFFSQAGQDKYLYDNFFKNKKNGVFIDIGAHDGVTFSNTFFFEKNLDWSGICIEPIPSVFLELEKNRNSICINGCIAGKNGEREFLVVSGYSEMLSGLVDSYDSRHLDRIDKELIDFGGKKEIIKVQCYFLMDLFSYHNIKNIDFLGIDTEGSELEILRSIDFSVIDIEIVCIENNYNDPEIKKFLQKEGYIFLVKVGGDEIYKKIKK